MASNAIQDMLTPLARGEDWTPATAQRAFQIVMSGGATPAQVAALLMGLRIKGETVAEITAAAQVLRHKALTFHAPPGTIDTCGTGGDGTHTLNISTATAIVTAACGVPVAKHGNRGVTSASGSSDLLSALGVDVHASPETSQRALCACGLCFLMAPLYHEAMRHVAMVRQELGLRTIFNILGPLANPARTSHQLLGVYHADWLRPLAHVLDQLGVEKAWVVHGHDGMDEISTTAPTSVVVLDRGDISEHTLTPEALGVERSPLKALQGRLPQDNARALEGLLSGALGPYRDIVCVNSAAALVIAEAAADMAEGMARAAKAIDSGAAKRTLAMLVDITSAASQPKDRDQ